MAFENGFGRLFKITMTTYVTNAIYISESDLSAPVGAVINHEGRSAACFKGSFKHGAST